MTQSYTYIQQADWMGFGLVSSKSTVKVLSTKDKVRVNKNAQ